MYAQAIGGQLAASPTELLEQQQRWEKERAENAKITYQSQLAHAALTLRSGANGANFTVHSALEEAHNIIQGAKKYLP